VANCGHERRGVAQLPPPFGFRSSVRRASKLAELGTQQVIEHEGAVVANPAHVVTRTGLLRRFIIQTSSLRIADKERDSKAAALYAHMTSDRFWQLQSQDNEHANCSTSMLPSRKLMLPSGKGAVV
jgi:hypothetical protein